MKDVFLIFCAFVANFPDIDTVVTRALSLEHYNNHRTWSHSFLGSILFVPSLALALMFLLPQLSIGFYSALFITWACFYSHLLTDWITAYGICLFWVPGTKNVFYGLGVITIFDSVTLCIWYSAFIASWYNMISPTVLLVLFSAVLFAWLSWKRVLLYIALRHSYSLSKGPLEDSWLQPASFSPHLFGYFYGTQDVKLKADIRPLQLAAERENAWPRDKGFGKLLIEAFFTSDLGYTRAAPREALINGNKKGQPFKLWMRKHTILSLCIVLSHAIWFIYASYSYFSS